MRSEVDIFAKHLRARILKIEQDEITTLLDAKKAKRPKSELEWRAGRVSMAGQMYFIISDEMETYEAIMKSDV